MHLADDAAAVATIDAAWIALAGGLAGIVLTLLGALIGAIIQGRREHMKWIRDQRLHAYADHLAATDNFLRAAQQDSDGSELSAVTTDSIRAMSVVQLVGPDRVAEIAAAFQTATKEVVGRVNLHPRDPALDRLDKMRELGEAEEADSSAAAKHAETTEDVQARHARWTSEYERYGLVRPTWENMVLLAAHESQRLLGLVLNSTRRDFLLAGFGLLVSTGASIGSLFLG